MAAKLRPRVSLPRLVSIPDARAPEARGRQLQRLVGRRVALQTPGLTDGDYLEVAKISAMLWNERRGALCAAPACRT
jgi:hypothetical protein